MASSGSVGQQGVRRRGGVACAAARGVVLRGHLDDWEVGPRSSAELREAAAHFERAAALHPAPLAKADFADGADLCRRAAES